MSAPALAAPRTVVQALGYARDQHDHETQDWTGYCQMFVRSCYAIPQLFGSAWAQWLGADDEDKHVGGNPAKAPVGAALCYKGSGPYGHIMLAARPNDAGIEGAWSNDLVRSGDIDWASRTAPTTSWGQQYLGYLTAVNDYDLPVADGGVPKPKLHRYDSIAKAIERMQRALARAQEQDERRDIKVIRTEIQHLRELDQDLRWTA